MMLTSFEEKAGADRLEGWELAEFLQIPFEDVLWMAYELNYINEETVDDVRELIGVNG